MMDAKTIKIKTEHAHNETEISEQENGEYESNENEK